MKRTTFLLALAGVAGAAMAPAAAQKVENPDLYQAPARERVNPSLNPEITRGPAEVAVAGQVVMRFREPVGGYTPAERRKITWERLRPILSVAGLSPSDVEVRRMPGEPYATIWVRDNFLVTVTDSMAENNGTASAYALAKVWAEQLKRTLPVMAVKPPQPGQLHTKNPILKEQVPNQPVPPVPTPPKRSERGNTNRTSSAPTASST